MQQALAHKESELAQLFKQNQDLTFLVSGADQKYQELLEQARKVIGEKDSVIAQMQSRITELEVLLGNTPMF